MPTTATGQTDESSFSNQVSSFPRLMSELPDLVKQGFIERFCRVAGTPGFDGQ